MRNAKLRETRKRLRFPKVCFLQKRQQQIVGKREISGKIYERVGVSFVCTFLSRHVHPYITGNWLLTTNSNKE
jgi:hypothetical protein